MCGGLYNQLIINTRFLNSVAKQTSGLKRIATKHLKISLKNLITQGFPEKIQKSVLKKYKILIIEEIQ